MRDVVHFLKSRESAASQRIFLLHDRRTTDLPVAIQAHASSGSEANAVISTFNSLTAQRQQDILNFLRGL